MTTSRPVHTPITRHLIAAGIMPDAVLALATLANPHCVEGTIRTHSSTIPASPRYCRSSWFDRLIFLIYVVSAMVLEQNICQQSLTTGWYGYGRATRGGTMACALSTISWLKPTFHCYLLQPSSPEPNTAQHKGH